MRTFTLADLPGVPERFDRLYWQFIPLADGAPLLHRATTREISEPYRTGRSVVIRLGRMGLVVGRYARPVVDPEDANAVAEVLRRAVSLRTPTTEELDEFDDERKLHGPGRPVGLRVSATQGRAVRAERPGPGVAAPADAGAGRVLVNSVQERRPSEEVGLVYDDDDWEFRGRW